ncbi:MAG: hypothetical protein KIT09_11935 [Bryobacteraceae bacterium]|nr:hypothetical protein [Bryobacteraceae bacterium]
MIAIAVLIASPPGAATARDFPAPIVFTQVRTKAKSDDSRLSRLNPQGAPTVLSAGFFSASDPEISFDGARILFAGRKTASDRWQIFEMQADGAGIRQITREAMDCRNPIYLSPLWILSSEEPSHTIAFVGATAGGRTNLFSVHLDGTGIQQLSHNPYGDLDPLLMEDGRILFAGRQSHRVEAGPADRMPLFGVNIDGVDLAFYAGDQGAAFKRAPAVTAGRDVVFVESDAWSPDGAGTLASVSLRRALYSYRKLTDPSHGLFRSPSALPSGEVLVARRPAAGKGTYGLYRFNPSTGSLDLVYDDPARDDLQPKAILPRPQADGRSSVVDDKDPSGVLYCLNSRLSDIGDGDWLPPGAGRRLRVVEGIPASGGGKPAARVLGELNVEDDGSFHIRVPANTPIQLQLLDEDGIALRACRWIWVRNHENRGCIGCHEDPELTPENRMAEALFNRAANLTLPPERRRTITFNRDIAPILAAKCATGSCHVGSGVPRIAAENDLRIHVSGMAGASPVIWRLFGRKITRPWDHANGDAPLGIMPPGGAAPLTEDEKRTIIEWIDMGAQQ